MRIGTGGTNEMALRMGVSSSSGFSWIQSTAINSSQTELALNPAGGNVVIGNSTGHGTFDVEGSYGVILNAGNVGIGTTGPAFALDVSGVTRSSQGYGAGTSSTTPVSRGWYYANDTTSSDVFLRADTSTENFYVTMGGAMYAAGNVGIGTTSPQSKLHIQAGEVQVGSSGASCATANAGAIRYNAGTLYYCDNASTWESIDSSGTSPTGDYYIATQTATPTSGQGLFGGAATLGGILAGYGSTADVTLENRNDTPALQILANSTNVYMPGNVGIGTTGPNAPLSVYYSSSGNGMTLNNAQGSFGGSIGFQKSGTFFGGVGDARVLIGGATNDMAMIGYSGQGLQFGVNSPSTPSMVINTSGNVGIGTTAPTSPLVVTAPTTFTSGTLTSVVAPAAAMSGVTTMTGLNVNMSAPTISGGNSGITALSTTAFTGGNNGSSNYGIYVGNINGNGSSYNASVYINAATGGTGWGGTGIRITGGGTGIHDYAIYSDDAAQSYFAGNVGIGTTAPGNTLDVNGAASIGYPGTAAPSNGLIVSGKVTIGTTVVGAENPGLTVARNAILNNVSVGKGWLGGGDVVIGGTASTLANSTSDTYTIAIGFNALSVQNYSGYSDDVAIGAAAMRYATTTQYSTAVGVGALSNTSFNGNGETAFGYQAGKGVTTGNYNIAIGYDAGSGGNIGTGANNIVIGQNVDVPTANGSNQLNIGNLIYATGLATGSTASTGNVGIGTTAPGTSLQVGTDLSMAYNWPAIGFNVNAGTGNYMTTNYGAEIIENYTSGYLEISSYASGTAGSGLGSGSQLILSSNGNIGIGTTVPDSPLHISTSATGNQAAMSGTVLHVTGADNTSPRVVIDGFGTNAAAFTTIRYAGGTAASPSALLNGNEMGDSRRVVIPEARIAPPDPLYYSSRPKTGTAPPTGRPLALAP